MITPHQAITHNGYIGLRKTKCGFFRPQMRQSGLLTYAHTYIISNYNPSARIIDLVARIIYVMCVNFIHKIDAER